MIHSTHAIYQRGATHLQTTATPDASGTLWADWSDKTAADYIAELNADLKPGDAPFELIDVDEACKLIDEAMAEKYLNDWTEITRDEWEDKLNILPPEKWQTVAGVEIFRMCEYLTGNITQHLARIGDRYFTANRRTSEDYADLAAEVVFTAA